MVGNTCDSDRVGLDSRGSLLIGLDWTTIFVLRFGSDSCGSLRIGLNNNICASDRIGFGSRRFVNRRIQRPNPIRCTPLAGNMQVLKI